MGIFTRFADIVNSNLNAMLDGAENPEKMLHLIIQEMEHTLVEVRSSSAKTIAQKKELRRRIADKSAMATNWQEKAELAVSKGRDDLAKAALVEKQNIEQAIVVEETELQQLEVALEKLNEDVRRLQEKLNEARSRRKTYALRQKTATSRIKVKSQLNSQAIDDAFTKFEVFEQKMDRLEAEVEAFDLGKGKTLSDQIDDLVVDEAIDAELEELKSKYKKAS
ncbi:MAG: phage shock protein PspA [Gammaproteobacteria bacterium]|nr:phage shock protein PspA [Gammaproteobacteria bacterium]NNJ71977.1 phage shock protein PspA [Enterobacterales bacterium]